MRSSAAVIGHEHTPAHTPTGATGPMDAKQLGEALAHAEGSVKAARACRPEHGLLTSILLKLGRGADAEEVVIRAFILQTGPRGAVGGSTAAAHGWRLRASLTSEPPRGTWARHRAKPPCCVAGTARSIK
jgi:hypothetical protein